MTPFKKKGGGGGFKGIEGKGSAKCSQPAGGENYRSTVKKELRIY